LAGDAALLVAGLDPLATGVAVVGYDSDLDQRRYDVGDPSGPAVS
jgi:hypothetical protein